MRKRTLANLSKLPDDAIEGLRILLKGGTAIDSLESAFDIQSSLPHSTLCSILKVQDASADDLYEAMDWLSDRQQEIEPANRSQTPE